MNSDSGSALEAAARQRHAEGDYVAALGGYEDAFTQYQAEGQTEAAARTDASSASLQPVLSA